MHSNGTEPETLACDGHREIETAGWRWWDDKWKIETGCLIYRKKKPDILDKRKKKMLEVVKPFIEGFDF